MTDCLFQPKIFRSGEIEVSLRERANGHCVSSGKMVILFVGASFRGVHRSEGLETHLGTEGVDTGDPQMVDETNGF